jgi:hypothetical protein
MILMILPTWSNRGIFSPSWACDAKIQYQINTGFSGTGTDPNGCALEESKTNAFSFRSVPSGLLSL